MRRDDLVTTIRRERNRAGQTRDRWIAREIACLLKVLRDHLADVEARIETLVAACKDLAEQRQRLRSVPGIGPAGSAVLPVRLPELGQLDRRQIASLAGLDHTPATAACSAARGASGADARIRAGRSISPPSSPRATIQPSRPSGKDSRMQENP